MRERGVLTVLVMVVAAVHEITAIPTAAGPHQPAGSTIEANHVEDQYLDDALGDWLDNFGTYTFMVKQDLDTHAGDADEGEGGGEEGQEVDIGVAIEEAEGLEDVREEEEEEEEKEEEWSAPIALSTGSRSLLDPHRDYLVTVESLVAEEGSIFLTLSKYENQTTCGVGGLTQEEEVRQEPRRVVGRGFDVAEGSSSGGNDHHTTFIAFGLQQEGNATSPDTSRWVAVSEQYWWASGQLAGGGMLSITFTPPECGCLALSTYFALPVGNLTLVVGPQAYPDELQVLLCVDPLATVPDHEYDDEEEEEEVVDYLQQPSALVASRNPGEDEAETETEESPEQQPTVAPRKGKMSREEKKTAKKTRRQMKRQRIRQAGRRQARHQSPSGGRRTGRRWNRKKNHRKRTRVWKKLHKRGRKGRRGGRHHHHHDGVNGTAPETMMHHQHHQHHQHQHHDAASGLNASIANQQEERLVDILLRDLPAENSTLEDEIAEESSAEEGEVAMANEEVEGEGEEHQTPRQRMKNRRQRKKMLRKQRRKAYPPGVKFCCKQGVKHKKNILEIDSTSGNSPRSCNMSIDVVSTFANHQFGIEEDTCITTFTTCCDRFTDEMWEGIKAKKEARKMERKQRRKSRRQDRKHRRRQGRRHRKGMKRQPHTHHDEHEEPVGCTGEGDACGHAH